MKVWALIANALQSESRCAMVSVIGIEGSAPREAGARMIVVPSGFHGTIGGGTLEWRALATAQAMLERGPAVQVATHALGPDLGQCCGGRVTLLTEVFGRGSLEQARLFARHEKSGSFICESHIGIDAVEREIAPSTLSMAGFDPAIHAHSSPDGRVKPGHGEVSIIETFGQSLRPLYLFGAGHVGRALVLALAPLPFAITWIDPRPDAFPSAAPGNVTLVRSNDPAAELKTAPPGSFVLVLTHSHALDLAIVDAALRNPDIAFVGLIGSATKRARFERRLRDAGVNPVRIAALACPIGIPDIRSKTPPVIAASAVAQVLIQHEMLKTQSAPAAEAQKRLTLKAGRGR